jgi:uncharacterized membrane protein
MTQNDSEWIRINQNVVGVDTLAITVRKYFSRHLFRRSYTYLYVLKVGPTVAA